MKTLEKHNTRILDPLNPSIGQFLLETTRLTELPTKNGEELKVSVWRGQMKYLKRKLKFLKCFVDTISKSSLTNRQRQTHREVGAQSHGSQVDSRVALSKFIEMQV